MEDEPSTNPFLSDIEESVVNSENKSLKQQDLHEISLDTVAAKLLKDNFYLTALEFYTELAETGRELPRLRDYFSNPGNFERTKDDFSSTSLHRTSSIQTFDSLDFARYSDDGAGQVDERVAVLEFELRKAHDTIKSLRASLTQEAETELGPTDQQNEASSSDQIKLRDKRALNFLVNEYLLHNNYKLTSVTFSEENEDQDFEDWDDVGLNIPRPPDLLHLYKDFGSHVTPIPETCDVCCDVDMETDHVTSLTEEWDQLKEILEKKISSLEEEVLRIGSEKEQLLAKEASIQNQSCDNQTHNSISINLLTLPPGSDRDSLSASEHSFSMATEDSQNKNSESVAMATDNRSSENLNCDISLENYDHKYSNGEVEEDNVSEKNLNESCDMVAIDTNDCESSLENENRTNVQSPTPEMGRNLSPAFRKALLDVCFHVSKDNRIVDEVSKIVDSSKDNVVLMLGRCLPHIVPNVLLAKREELIPLILCTAMLHPEAKERDKLLNISFNLIKRPDDEQRQMILTGCIAYAQHAGHNRMMEELLPQCWEQINHKYTERRILVAEACGALAPYLPKDILSSLILSMLQQMLMDDKDEEVRDAVVRSLGLLFGFINDTDKYSQGSELLRTALKDCSEKVVTAAQQIFLPSFASWAYELEKLEHNLLHSILRDLEDICAIAAQRASNSTTIPLNEGRFLILLTTLQELLPFLYISVIQCGPYLSKLEDVISNFTSVDMSRFPKPTSPLTDLRVIMGDNSKLSALVHLFEEHLSQEWFEPWEMFNWVVNNLIPRLLEIVMGAGLSIPKVVSSLCRCFFRISRTFGRIFVEKKIRPKFIELLVLTDDHADNHTYATAKQLSVTTAIIPVYAAGVLSAFNSDEDRQQLTQFLQEILCTLSLYKAPLDSIKLAFTELSTNPTNHELLLMVLWDGVVHTSAEVRATAARLFELMVKGVSENLISSRVFPALVTLGSDAEIIVRCATIPALGAIIENVGLAEMLDRVYMQFVSFMDDPMYRNEHQVHIELIRTLSRVAPNAEPRFRDEWIFSSTVFKFEQNYLSNYLRCYGYKCANVKFSGIS
ncbi:hypothetical protein FSP39_002678 [Pinctada imbricata]|uniref:LisH domain-containing protein n=1 Tax=Pinctada imbricata TaxID=66713 RepID=A0AA89BNB4_PINIB|nr:hypothetical protein FSP39_002678 [Pinctada imbricata]